jgi:hypothetical protein
MDELVAGGTRAIEIVCDDRYVAASLLSGVRGVECATDGEDALRVTLSPEAPVDREIVTELLRHLLAEGIAIERVAPVTASLEDRFLTVTTPLEDRS